MTYRTADHLCRKCGGRILERISGNGMTPGGNRIKECADSYYKLLKEETNNEK